jgi:hypothetical protein
MSWSFRLVGTCKMLASKKMRMIDLVVTNFRLSVPCWLVGLWAHIELDLRSCQY